jgi:hypothetical protein
VIQQTLAHPKLLPSPFSFCTNFSDERENAAPIHHGYSTAAPSVLKALFNTASTP